MLSTSLTLRLSHPRHHKFKYEFEYLLNPICRYENDIETTIRYLLYCSNLSD